MAKATQYKLIIERFLANVMMMLKSFFMAIPLGVVSALITILVIKIYQSRTKTVVKIKKRNAVVLFASYVAVIMQMAILSRPWGTISVIDLIPFDTPGGIRYIVLYSIANMVMFMPLGVFLPIIWKRTNKLKWVLIAGFCGSLFIEVSQLLLQCGVFQTEDLIMNTIGTGLGYLMYKKWRILG